MKIKVLGSGCPNCKKLEENVREACRMLGIEAKIEKVQDYGAIAEYGVMSLPALVIDGEVKIQGRIPKIEELARMLRAV